jgi:hypothetical protein
MKSRTKKGKRKERRHKLPKRYKLREVRWRAECSFTCPLVVAELGAVSVGRTAQTGGISEDRL